MATRAELVALLRECRALRFPEGEQDLAARIDAALAEPERDELDSLTRAESSSAREAASVLLKALGWSSGGLGSAAIEVVRQRDQLAAEVERLRREIEFCSGSCTRPRRSSAMTDYTQLANEAKAYANGCDAIGHKELPRVLRSLCEAVEACQRERDELAAKCERTLFSWNEVETRLRAARGRLAAEVERLRTIERHWRTISAELRADIEEGRIG